MSGERPETPEAPGLNAAIDGVPATCPACRAAQQAVEALLQHLGTSDPDTAPWLGMCNTHAWQCSEHTLLSRRIAAARLEAALDRLDGGSSAGGHTRQRTAPSADACPFCAAMAAAAETATQAAPIAAAALCLPHLCTALEQVCSRERLQALVTTARAQGDVLEQELSELIRKSDYRFRDEPRGLEATSWRRAAERLAGMSGVRWPLRREPEIEG